RVADAAEAVGRAVGDCGRAAAGVPGTGLGDAIAERVEQNVGARLIALVGGKNPATIFQSQVVMKHQRAFQVFLLHLELCSPGRWPSIARDSFLDAFDGFERTKSLLKQLLLSREAFVWEYLHRFRAEFRVGVLQVPAYERIPVFRKRMCRTPPAHKQEGADHAEYASHGDQIADAHFFNVPAHCATLSRGQLIAAASG